MRKPSEWPGATALKALLKGVAVVGHWFNRTEAYRAKRRGEKVGPWDHAEEESFELAPLPCWAELTAAERQAKAQALVQEIERETRERFAKQGKSPLGARRIMNQHPHSEPRSTKRSPAPLVHAASPEEWITYKRTWLYFVDCYREAANRLKKGDLTVIFPEGSIPPRLPSFRTHGQPRPAPGQRPHFRLSLEGSASPITVEVCPLNASPTAFGRPTLDLDSPRPQIEVWFILPRPTTRKSGLFRRLEVSISTKRVRHLPHLFPG